MNATTLAPVRLVDIFDADITSRRRLPDGDVVFCYEIFAAVYREGVPDRERHVLKGRVHVELASSSWTGEASWVMNGSIVGLDGETIRGEGRRTFCLDSYKEAAEHYCSRNLFALVEEHLKGER